MCLGRRVIAASLDGLVVGSLAAIPTPLMWRHFAGAYLAQHQLTIPWASAALVGIAVIDSTILPGAIPVAVVIMVGWLLTGRALMAQDLLSFAQVAAASVLTLYIVNTLYNILSVWLGQTTLGKSVMGLRVSKEDGRRVGLIGSCVRSATKWLMPISIYVPLAYFLCNRTQLIHDRIARTAVYPKTCALAAEPKDIDPNLQHRCASIPRRVVASCIDAVLFYTCESVVYITGIRLLLHSFMPGVNPMLYVFISTAFFVGLPASALAAMVINATFECSHLQATPGKILAGIMVANLEGTRLNFRQAFEKQIIQAAAYISLFPVVITVYSAVMIAWAHIDHAENDLLAWVAVGFVASFVLLYGTIVCVTFWRGQTLVDRLSKRVCLLAEDVQPQIQGSIIR
jgi:uncharacterized RDD family membrane protein YckC